MKCRSCWTDKAYLREDQSLRDVVWTYLGVVPLKCHHCYQKFWVPFFMTWGQRLHPPKMREPDAAAPESGQNQPGKPRSSLNTSARRAA